MSKELQIWLVVTALCLFVLWQAYRFGAIASRIRQPGTGPIHPPQPFPGPPPVVRTDERSPAGCDHSSRRTVTKSVSSRGGVWTYWCPACGALGSRAIAGRFSSGPDWQYPRRAAS